MMPKLFLKKKKNLILKEGDILGFVDEFITEYQLKYRTALVV